jgi:DNA-binding transcriptional LysR family regulator
VNIDPAQLRLLALIDRHGSLTGAAHALGLTPAAVTQQLARAERDCGAPLVARGPRGATLTAAGAALAECGRVIDAQVAVAEERLAGLLGRLALRLRIGAFQAAAIHLVPPALTALRHRRPEADISVVDVLSEQGPDQVADGALDLAVIASWSTPPLPPPHVSIHPLLLDPMVVVLPDDHPQAAPPRGAPPQAPLRLAELADDSWVTILAGHAAREQFDRAAAAAGFTPKIRSQTASYDVAQAMVGTGYGVALVSRLALTHVPGTVHRVLAEPALHRRIHAVTAADTTLTPLVPTFLELLRDVATDVEAQFGQGDHAGR